MKYLEDWVETSCAQITRTKVIKEKFTFYHDKTLWLSSKFVRKGVNLL